LLFTQFCGVAPHFRSFADWLAALGGQSHPHRRRRLPGACRSTPRTLRSCRPPAPTQTRPIVSL